MPVAGRLARPVSRRKHIRTIANDIPAMPAEPAYWNTVPVNLPPPIVVGGNGRQAGNRHRSDRGFVSMTLWGLNIDSNDPLPGRVMSGRRGQLYHGRDNQRRDTSENPELPPRDETVNHRSNGELSGGAGEHAEAPCEAGRHGQPVR